MKLLNTLQTPWGLYRCISLGLRVRFWAAWLILRQELSWILFLNAHLAVPLALLVLLVLLVLLARLPHCSAHQACWLPSWGFKHWCYTGRTSQLSHLNTYFTAFCFFYSVYHMLSPAPFRNAFPELESSIKCQFFRFLWQTGLPWESTLPASVMTNFKAVTILPNKSYNSQSLQSLQALTESSDESESESGLPAKHEANILHN